MPRDVFPNLDANIVYLTPQRSSHAAFEATEPPESPSKRLFNTPKLDASKGSSNTMQQRRPIEIIELSSSSEDESSPTVPRRLETYPPSSKSLFTPARKAATSEEVAPTSAATKSPRKRKYVLSSSSEDEVGPKLRPSPPMPGDPLPEMKSMSINRPDIHFNEDGVIEYIPSPRRPINFSPSKAPRKETEGTKRRDQFFSPKERRLTLLEPDSPEKHVEDLSWELEQDDMGGVRLGGMLTEPIIISTDDEHASPQKPGVGIHASQTLAVSPTKQPRRKKMPEAVAALHRIAIPYLKEMDVKVFNGQLGASYFADLGEPPAPGKKRRGQNDAGVIWGMGSRGEYNDGKGSFIELVWSNRMATTAGRTEYKKTASQQIITKIELGVKVVTTEGMFVAIPAFHALDTSTERLRNTLAHEACHAATWAISGDFKQPHGSTFKSWAKKVMAAFPGVQVTTKHSYEIEYKFSWKCVDTKCAQLFQRHSNSINIEEQGCFCGARLEPQFKLPVKKGKTVLASAKVSSSASLSNAISRAFPLPLNDLRSASIALSSSEDEAKETDLNHYTREAPSETSPLDDLTSALKSTVI